MRTFQILIDSVEKVLDFNQIIDGCEFDVDLGNGHTYVDAKSLVGIFSLPLYGPLQVVIHADRESSNQLEARLEDYIVRGVSMK